MATNGRMFLIARFHARPGCQVKLQEAILAVSGPTCAEADCVSFQAFQALGDDHLFFIHSVWSNEAAFEQHTTLPHTVEFISVIDNLIDQPSEITRLARRV